MEEQANKRQKFLMVVLIVVVIGAVIFFISFNSSNIVISEMTFDDFGNPIETLAVGQDLINLLDRLQSVELDSSIFNSPAFKSLTDYSIQLPTIPQGRLNPFQSI